MNRSKAALSSFQHQLTLCLAFCILLVLLLPTDVFVNGHGENKDDHDEDDVETDTNSTFSTRAPRKGEGVSVVGFHWKKLTSYLIILFFVTIVVIMKLIYHHLELIASYIPESCLLIAIGVCFGVILKTTASPETLNKFHLNSDVFFLVLLPPIVLEAAYSLYNKTFAENMGVIVIFAVVGTVLNFILIGLLMGGVNAIGWMGPPDLTFTLRHFLLFSSIIVAVDPVAVLAIFSEIGVDRCLYFMVFGESLLNDAVTIVLYSIMAVFCGQSEITPDQIALGVASFFTVSLGGLLVGILVGVVCSLLTRFTLSQRYLEPMIMYVFGYLSYILGDLFAWSGIIAMVGCGLVQSAYAFHNVSWKSLVVIKRASKVAASVSEAIIFFYLGVEVFIHDMRWHTGFHLWALSICLVVRFLVTFLLCFIINWAKVDHQQISVTEQIIMSYGGLRGAVSFSLAALVKSSMVGGSDNARIILTATFIVIIVTVVPIGMTIKPLVKLMKIRLEGPGSWSLFGQMNETVSFHMLAAIETIGENFGRNRLRIFFQRLDEKYVRRFLQRDPETHSEKIVKTYQKVALAMHYASVNPRQSEHYLDKLSSNLRRSYSSQLNVSSLRQSSSQSSVTAIMTQMPETRLINEPRMSITAERGKSLLQQSDVPVITGLLRKARNSIVPEEEGDYFSQFSQVMQNKKRLLKKHRRNAIQTSRSSGMYRRGARTNDGYLQEDVEMQETKSTTPVMMEEERGYDDTPRQRTATRTSSSSSSEEDAMSPFVEEVHHHSPLKKVSTESRSRSGTSNSARNNATGTGTDRTTPV